jgi:hypothetical protein
MFKKPLAARASSKRSARSALIQNISSLLMGNAPGTYPEKEKAKETDRRNRNWFAPFYLLPLVFDMMVSKIIIFFNI